MARRPMTIPFDAVDRATSDQWGSVRRWRPIVSGDSAVVEIHNNDSEEDEE